jgi:Holliday junction resolvase RusA-like endonuclease
MTIKLTVLGEPSAQPRHRHYTMGSGVQMHVQTYDPATQAKQTFASILQQDAPKTPIDEPIMLEMNFYMRRPKSHYGTGKNISKIKPNAPEWCATKPDVDNLAKFVQDALNKIFYRDDSLICQITCRKLYSEKPRTEITITTLSINLI